MEPLQQGALALDVPLSDTQAASLLEYLALLRKWGAVYNLTAVRDPLEMLHHHLLDSLAVVAPLRAHLQGRAHPGVGAHFNLLDVGSGAGLPGVVLAVCMPDLQVRCVDTVAKKAAFVQQVAGGVGAAEAGAARAAAGGAVPPPPAPATHAACRPRDRSFT